VSRVHVQVRLGGEAYALPASDVLEVAPLELPTPIPGASPFVLGVRNVRGRVVPVFALGALTGASGAGPAVGGASGPGRLCVAAHGDRVAGLAVDDVTDVGELPDGGDVTEGGVVARSLLVGGRLVGVVDVARLFAELERRGGT
jgi:chemotaxis signal transduction protein